MAKKRFTLLDEAFTAGADFLTEGRQAGDEFEHDFYNPETERNSEQAAIAAGWVAPVEDEPAPKPADKKGGAK